MLTRCPHTTRSYLRIAARYVCGVVCSLLISLHVATAQPKLTSEISPTAGSQNDLFLFTVTVEGERVSGAPLLSGGEDFALSLLGPRTSISIVNGNMRSRVSYVYQLTPKREGRLSTPKAELTVNGQTISAPPIEVVIAKGAGEPTGLTDQAPKESLFLRQTASPTHVFQGQQIVHAITVYTRVDLNELSLEDLTNDGFWQESIATNDRSVKEVDGVQYTAVEMSNALFPLRTGNLVLPARKLHAKIPARQSNDPLSLDPFDDHFFNQFFDRYQLKSVTISSNPLSIEVKPLPPVPAEFQKSIGPVPIVGATAVRVSYPPEAISTGETKTVTVEVVSEGNLNPLKTIQLQTPTGFKVYDERPETKMERRNGHLITHKKFKFSVLPFSPGMARIPAVSISYFDPISATYTTARSSDIAFPVQGADISASSSQQQTGGADNVADQNATTSGLIPTLPSVPIAPPLSYNEPTFSERVASYVSIQLALLLLAGVGGVGILALIIQRRAARGGALDSFVRSLNDVANLKQFEEFMRELISTRVSKVSETSSMDELRSRVMNMVPDQAVALALSSVLDDIEVLNYGKQPTDGSVDISALKGRLATILTQWRE